MFNQQENSNETNQVLIVDDIPENLQVLSNILYEKGIEISFATNGKQALETIAYNPPDLILLDISMPEMDGYEVCERLKKSPETIDIPVIFLTARTQTEDVIKGFEIGAVDYVTKPFNASELVSRVFTHLELKKSRDIIDRQNMELKELNATKDKFFSIVAHDLKNPFNTMMGFAELLLMNFERMEKEKVKKFHRLMYKASKNGFDLLENLLQWARAQTGRLQWEPSEIDMKILVSQNFDLLNSNAQNKNIALVSKITQPLTCFADGNMISTVLRNLISNAIKFSKPGGQIIVSAKTFTKIVPVVTDEADEQEDKPTEKEVEFAEITVSDKGVGMKEKDIKKLFRIDVHHTTPGTNEEQGTGLGLILCKEFVEKNGGSIRVESTFGKGSDFIFTIPREKL